MIQEITISILAVGVFSFLIYEFLDWKYKRQLTKLRRNYQPQDDISRRENKPDGSSVEAGLGTVVQRESISKGTPELERRELLETETDNGTRTDEPNIEPTKPKPFWKRGRKKVVDESEAI